VSVLVVFIVYLLALAAIGAYCARFNRTLADFVLGGRRLGTWVTALSAQASDMSGWLLIGLPGVVYLSGLSALWAAVGCAVGTVFNWTVIAPRLRRDTERSDALTIPDYLASRYGEGRLRLVRVVSVLVILLAYATYIASQFTAAGKVFETTFAHVPTPWGAGGLSYHAGILVGTGIAQFWGVVKPLFGGDLLFANGLIPGFVLHLVVAYLVSLATGAGGDRAS